jgi:uncharacterized membrane protein HdeD (DUF308 family)
MNQNRLPPRVVGLCFIASIVISYAGAVVLGPQTAGAYVIVLGVLAFAAAVVLERVAPMTEVNK